MFLTGDKIHVLLYNYGGIKSGPYGKNALMHALLLN